MREFKDKVVVITGASSGIGEALARQCARLGARVVMAARNKAKLDEIAGEIEAEARLRDSQSIAFAGDGLTPLAADGLLGRKVLTSDCDVSKESDCQRLISSAVEAFGGIDILICNAGVSMRAILDDVSTDVLRQLMDVNFWGTVYCVKYALPFLQASHGSIVGVSSVAGLHGLPGRTGYSASKYAMTGFLETVRIENMRRGVHVMIACPGFTATNVRFSALTADGSAQGETPRNEGKMMTADKVACLIINGIRRRKRLLLMEFEGRATHLIKKFAPAILDRMFYKVMAREPNSPLKVGTPTAI